MFPPPQLKVNSCNNISELVEKGKDLLSYYSIILDLSCQRCVRNSILLHKRHHNNSRIAWTSVAWALWTVELPTTFTLLNYGQAMLVIMCGVGCLLLQPCALKYGRRSTYVFGSALILCGLILGVKMTSINYFFAYMILAGFGSAPSYATIITSLIDISFLHQKGRILSLYGAVLILGNFLPPVAAGYIVQAQGWKWCFNYLIIFFAVATLILIVGAEETIFPRAHFQLVAIDAIERHLPTESSQNQLQQTTSITKPPGEQDDQTEIATYEPGSSHIATKRYTYLQKMVFFRRNPIVKASYFKLCIEVFELFVLPGPMWASAMIGLGTFVVGLIFTTQASFFAAPPYNFNPSQLGLMYFALIIGNLIGSIYGGSLADWVVLWKAKRNKGISEPEHRLIAYHPMGFIAAGGILCYGVGASAGVHWAVPCFGMILIGFYLNASLPIALGYALDSYADIVGEVVQLTNFLRNVAGGAFTFGIQPWVNYNGARNTSIILAVLILVLNLSSIPLQIWGKDIRRRTDKSYAKIRARATFY